VQLPEQEEQDLYSRELFLSYEQDSMWHTMFPQVSGHDVSLACVGLGR
jgi:hypothetical protein